MSSSDPTKLIENAKALCAPGKGILASDESPSTIGRRLEKHGIENTADNRRKYRQLFYTSPTLNTGISGAILFPEALLQCADDGISFVQHLNNKGILPGVKVDEGLRPLLNGNDQETDTKGLETLRDRCVQYAQQGALFAKWRAALRVGGDGSECPSQAALEINAVQLAHYAKICQEVGLVPIVEPEILIDGDHDADATERATVRALNECIDQLRKHDILLEGCLLKPQMVIPGIDWKGGSRPSSEEIAIRTLRALEASVPRTIPGIMFLSGGQSEQEATINLNAINRAAAAAAHGQEGDSRYPWALSFSFGRALQASVLKLWSEFLQQQQQQQQRAHNEEEESEHRWADAICRCREMAGALGAVNGKATLGEYDAQRDGHPSLSSPGESLQETFRGWRP